MKNLSLSISPPETVQAFLAQDRTLPMLCLGTPDSPHAVWIFADEAVAHRIQVCVNSCNDLESVDLAGAEVRHVIAHQVVLAQRAMDLLRQLASNAFKIEHDSFHLQGHENFDPEAVINEAKALLEQHDEAISAAAAVMEQSQLVAAVAVEAAAGEANASA